MQSTRRTPALLKNISIEHSSFVEKKPNLTLRVWYKNKIKPQTIQCHYKKGFLNETSVYSNKLNLNQLYAVIPEYSNVALIELVLRRTILHPEMFSQFLMRTDYPMKRRILSASWPATNSIRCALINRERITVDTNSWARADYKGFTATASMLSALPTIQSKYPESWYTGLVFYIAPCWSPLFFLERTGRLLPWDHVGLACKWEFGLHRTLSELVFFHP